MSAAAKAIQAQAESLSTPSAPAHLTLVSIVGAKQQVVAGMNYRLQLKVDLDGTPREAEAVVWRKLSGEYKLTSWNWK